ncbi:exonuclease SbcC [Streptomyces yunnanensis]|uniref:Exonuclease SbcC n=1 Tax=Streptomyces yunnanensis TaxID=156453 RepID=A0ABY8AJW3_9ACTN|nr:exonuclease SbcC [Streptomyces yunnanensis]WEB45323.1 exonuclease SbcC [Streptomyces yunnanensis]
MATEAAEFVLSMEDLREVTAFAEACAQEALEIFEAERPNDTRPRYAVNTAREFASGGTRGKALRDAAWAALKAAKEADAAAAEAARAAMAAAGAAYLHPLPNATQVKHILGSAAHAARAAELVAGGDRAVGDECVTKAVRHATPALVDVLKRYPVAPTGGGRIGELTRLLDATLRR